MVKSATINDQAEQKADSWGIIGVTCHLVYALHRVAGLESGIFLLEPII